MAKITFLGTGAAVANADHENAHLLIETDARLVLIDCPGNPIPRLHRQGVDISGRLSDLVLTHFHADHVSGFAMMLQTAWLLGRTAGTTLHGLPDVIDRARAMLQLFDWPNWPGMFPIDFHTVAPEAFQPVLTYPDLQITASPVRHLIPNLGLRFDFPPYGGSAAYSSDTEPCPALVELANGVDVLIHEASGASVGHSSAEQAGEIARRAGAKKLYLIHYQTWGTDPLPRAAEARAAFGGDVQIARDGDVIEFSG